jgi:hypothetical protein
MATNTNPHLRSILLTSSLTRRSFASTLTKENGSEILKDHYVSPKKNASELDSARNELMNSITRGVDVYSSFERAKKKRHGDGASKHKGK